MKGTWTAFVHSIASLGFGLAAKQGKLVDGLLFFPTKDIKLLPTSLKPHSISLLTAAV